MYLVKFQLNATNNMKATFPQVLFSSLLKCPVQLLQCLISRLGNQKVAEYGGESTKRAEKDESAVRDAFNHWWYHDSLSKVSN
jgi:hypothetical protein